VTQLSHWIETRQLASERLTQIYLKRLERFDPKLKCVITLTRELALEQAKRADAEIAAGKYRGPLHGIPWGPRICSIRPVLRLLMVPSHFGIANLRRMPPWFGGFTRPVPCWLPS